MDIMNVLLSGAVGALFGAFITVFLTDSLQRKRILKEQKAEILRSLMATRFMSGNDQLAAEAINYIPVLFAEDKNIMEAYTNFHLASISNRENVSLTFTELVASIAKELGINIRSTDLMRTPILSKKRVVEDYKVNNEHDQMLENIKTDVTSREHYANAKN
jgi:hypothetical protein